jgi:hypothetical protein
MTISLPAPAFPAEGPDWRSIHPTPRDVRLDDGPWCPYCDAVLLFELRGMVCPECLAWWDHKGLNGLWITGTPALEGQVVDLGDLRPVRASATRRLDRAAAMTVVAAAVLLVGFVSGRPLLGAHLTESARGPVAAALVGGGLGLIVLALLLVLRDRRGGAR